MLSLRTFSLALAGVLAISVMGCGGGGGSGGSGGTGGSGGATTSTGGSGGTGGTGTTGGTGGTGGTSTTTGTSQPMTLTSPDITEGGEIPPAYTCAGKNVSPQLDWTPGPAGTLSYAIVFKDNDNGLIHSAIYDIPADTLGLPTNVETAQNPSNVPGAKQTKAYDQSTFGYLGPCPGGNLHEYTFTLYALDTAALPVAGNVSKELVNETAQEHDLATATLSAKSDANP